MTMTMTMFHVVFGHKDLKVSFIPHLILKTFLTILMFQNKENNL